MRIVVWSGIAQGAAVARHLSASYDVTTVDHEAELPTALAEADALVLENNRYNGDIVGLVRGTHVRWIQLLSAGYENVIAHGVPEGVVVTNAGAARSATVAEHGAALLLGLMHAVPSLAAAGREGAWRADLGAMVAGIEGKTLLIVGYGSIGRALAQRLLPFGARVTTASRRAEAADPAVSEAFGLENLDEALSQADIVALCIAYAPETHHLIAAAQLRAMRKGAFLLNLARGGIIDTRALVDALTEGHLAGAALDVTDPEPLPLGHALWGLPNVLVSPHLGGTPTEASSSRLCALVAENASRLERGLSLRHLVPSRG